MSNTSRRKFLTGGLWRAASGLTAAGNWPKALALGATDQVKVARPALPGRACGKEKLYGLMADAARVPEDVSYYHRLVDFCHEWELSALLISLTDDQGSALRFSSHPELITHAHALTPHEARSLSDYGRERGVQVIPIVESFGHTRYITGVPKYANLADRDVGSSTEFNGLIPVAPGTLSLMTDLYREVAELFSSPYLHGGCDEVNWGGSELSKRALQTHSRSQIWAEYLNALDGVARGLGKEFIVWGDYVLHKEPDILPLLRKDIIIMDWQYYVTDPKPLERIARQAIGAGHRVIGAPAIISCRWGPRAGKAQLENVEAYSDAYRSISGTDALGVIVTNWVPCRYIQNSLWDTFAYAAVAMKEGSAVARERAFRRFVETHYGAQWSRNWQEMFSTFYDITPNHESCSPAWMHPFLPIPWRSDETLKAVLADQGQEVQRFVQLLSKLRPLEGGVRKNLDDFLALRLSAEYIEHVFWRNQAVAEEKVSSSRSLASSAKLIEKIAGLDRRLLDELDRAWNAGRPEDAQSKLGPVFNLHPGDQLLFTFSQAAQYSAYLAQRPDQFYRLVTESEKIQAPPGPARPRPT